MNSKKSKSKSKSKSKKRTIKKKVAKELKQLTRSPEIVEQVNSLPPQQRKPFLKRLAVNVAQGVAIGLGITITAGAAYHLVGKKMVSDTVKDSINQVKNDKDFKKIRSNIDQISVKINEVDLIRLENHIKEIAEKAKDVDVQQLASDINSLRNASDQVDIQLLQNNINYLRGKIEEVDFEKLQEDLRTLVNNSTSIASAAQNPIGTAFSGIFGGSGNKSSQQQKNIRAINDVTIANIIDPPSEQGRLTRVKSKGSEQQNVSDRIKYLETDALPMLTKISQETQDSHLKNLAIEGIAIVNDKIIRLKRGGKMEFGKIKFNFFKSRFLMRLKNDLLKLNKIF